MKVLKCRFPKCIRLLPLFLPTPTGPANSSFCSAGIFNIFSGAFLAFTVMLAKKNMEQKTISIM